MADPVVVLEPGGERAQKIAKAMASQTAGDILRLVGEGPKTSTEISENLALPMTTAKYHIENLLEAGLISVASTKYSIKGREVKVYTLTNQLLIVAPKQLNVRSLLMKYAALFGIVAVGSLCMTILSPLAAPAGRMEEPLAAAAPQFAGVQGETTTLAKAAADAVVNNFSGGAERMVTGSKEALGAAAANLSFTHDTLASVPSPMPGVTQAPQLAGSPDAALAFFLGGVLVIVLLAGYEIWLWKRKA
jgi:DNA-binding transcriptional ArsR family regulator